MLKKRIIPCLDIKDGRTVKGVNFVHLRDAGDPVDLAKKYVQQGADELVFLDIAATVENRKTQITLVERIAKEINIPFAVGGGIDTLSDAEALIKSGADKVSLNSSAVKCPTLIGDIAAQFGSQAVVVAIDTKCIDNQWQVFVHGGRTAVELPAIAWAKEVEALGAGEILLTSMNSDGTKQGFDLEVIRAVSESVHIPVIASGGAGAMRDFKKVFQQTLASAALAASIFHFGEITIPNLKNYLTNEKIPIRPNR